ncbi:hypothetical protein UA08_06595 [Talaromyces atroroseus]|uniref:RBR-type E3 ubiquitin transferase n=1 Tax=Talaromyces atroroseus TaxID=1441469 RepID=A0A225ASB6_TALAT|nr:hypothetical protein UA08_06595 [Talaromyces atroroseus]OKL57856.1 hypothetical protein UA08_06595 [Talaromyces atroroseus]
MAYNQDLELALRLLLADLDALEERQKGKQVAGKLTDSEHAIATMRSDVIALRDQILAVSTSTAMATDQAILMSMAREEVIASQDHQTAVALDRTEESVNYFAQIGPPPPEDMSHNDAVSMVMRDLMNRASLTRQNNAGDTSLPSNLATQGHNTTIKCVCCLETREPFLRGYCGHELCRDCAREIYLGAIRDEELYPPRCCGRPFSPGIILQVLEYSEFRAFCEKALEYIAENRVYCAEPTCSTFIPPSAIHGDNGICPDCHQQTHLPCRALAHPGVDCPLDHTFQGVLAIADTQNWRRCFNCRTMVELERGCNHITCRCGSEFCYVCGLVWKTCHCTLWDDNMIIQVANQAVNDQVAPNARPEVRHDLFNRVLEDLRQHEDVGFLLNKKSAKKPHF